MKWLIGIATGLSTSAWGSASLTVGTYRGQGEWRNNQGVVGIYDIELDVAQDQWVSTYRFLDQQVTWTMSIRSTGYGFFEVVSDGQTVGRGYCVDQRCTYTAYAGNLEETLIFEGGAIRRYGSKHWPNESDISWIEILKKS